MRTQAFKSAPWAWVPPETQAASCKRLHVVLHLENEDNGGACLVVGREKGGKVRLTRNRTNTRWLVFHTCFVQVSYLLCALAASLEGGEHAISFSLGLLYILKESR